MHEQLKKAIALAKKTKTSVVMYNPQEPEETFVLLDINQYEKILEKRQEKSSSKDLTEDNLADKINREISLWKNQENSETIESEGENKNRWQIPPQVKNKAKEIE